ncbi:hypothetical protein O6H91_19G008800 [Diphasiastrum complanatum]|uniref:Uncharacterized protein n=1 Tax=Diphasiastrum complanatum TaxID=34168 RepID=A0ACC2ASQ2_DIPCM|nr:hypothetical protein O6H91_19G008800 [Diphasiastrum complanatum]
MDMADGMQSDGSIIPEDIRDGVLVRCNPQPLGTFLDGGGGGDKEGVGDKDEGHQWSEGAVNALLDSYGTRWNLCMRGNIKKAQWEEIAIEVSSRSNGTKVHKTRGQCKSKVEKLKRKFREEKLLLEKTCKLTSRWPYYTQMDVIMGSGQQRFSGIPNPLDGGHPMMVDQRAFSGCSPRFKGSCPDIAKAEHVLEGQLQDLPLYLKGKEAPSSKDDDDASCTTPKKRDRNVADNGENGRAKGGSLPGGSGKGCLKRRKMTGDADLAAAVKSFGETIFKIEQYKMENQKEADRMRVEMELKRTEMLMNAQMQIAKIFCDSFKKKAKKKVVTPLKPPSTD